MTCTGAARCSCRLRRVAMKVNVDTQPPPEFSISTLTIPDSSPLGIFAQHVPLASFYSSDDGIQRSSQQWESQGGNRRAQGGKVCLVGYALDQADASSDDPTYHALGLSSYLFNAGYMNQQWTDVQIIFFDQSLELHRSMSSGRPLSRP